MHGVSFSAPMLMQLKAVFQRTMVVDTACPPPITRRSVSFRLHFRLVRVVRTTGAGEAKLSGRMAIVAVIAGLPGCEVPCVCARFTAPFMLLFAWVLKRCWRTFTCSGQFCVVI